MPPLHLSIACHSVGIPLTIFTTLAIDTRHWRSLAAQVAESIEHIAVVRERRWV